MYLTQGLHRALQQRPDGIATVCDERRQTWRELGERVARLAGALGQLGVRRGDRVAMLGGNSDRYLEVYLAVFWAGAVLVPVNTRWSPAEMLYALEDSGAVALLADANFTTIAAGFETPALQNSIAIGTGTPPAGWSSYEQLLRDSLPVADLRAGGDELAAIFYTGGTTGRSKGVMLSHANLWVAGMNLLASGYFPNDLVMLHAAPMFHVGGGAFTIAQTQRGGTHVFLAPFTPEGVLEIVQREKVNHTLLVPTMLQMVVDHPRFREYDLSSLSHVWYGASPIAEAVLDRAIAALPGVQLVQGYGMTEIAGTGTVLGAEYHVGEGRKLGKTRSAGRPHIGVETRIVDAESRDLPPGQVGELLMRGPGLMQGYWNKPEATAETVRDGWLYSGDGAYRDEQGFIYIVDRLKDMIVTGGENVYSAEVESAVSLHQAVATCAVIGIPSEQWVEAVHAVVVLKAGATATAEDIQRHCRGLIAGFKCPRSVEFRDALPLSGAGKVLKTTLREPYWKKTS